MNVDTQKEVDRVLILLRNKIRERDFTQLKVQNQLGWGRSYLSQLLTKQKSLRVEQLLLVLDVIGISAADFYAELYRFPPTEEAPQPPSDSGPAPSGEEDYGPEYLRMKAILKGIVQLLLRQQVFDLEELRAATAQTEGAGALLGFGLDE